MIVRYQSNNYFHLTPKIGPLCVGALLAPYLCLFCLFVTTQWFIWGGQGGIMAKGSKMTTLCYIFLERY